jgi:chromosome segregation ATPase
MKYSSFQFFKIELFSNELEQANLLITRLKNLNKTASTSSESPAADAKSDEISNYKQKIALLKKKINEINETHAAEKASYENTLIESNIKLQEQEKQIDSLTLELKQQQQSIHQEKLLQMQDEKQEGKEIERLSVENRELKLKLDEKQDEIKQLGEQMNDLNTSIANLKSNDSSFLAELQQKTEQFLFQLDAANTEIASLKNQNSEYAEQQRQFEFVLEEKTRETSQLKIEAQQNIQHLSAQSKAMEKLQQDLKEQEKRETKNDELDLLKQQYDQVYTYLEQKNQESLNYYNEIQRLNQVVSELTDDLQNAKNINENLNEQYDNLVKEFQLEQKMVDDLNQQTSELNNTLMSTTNAISSLKLEPEEREIKLESNTLTQATNIKREVGEENDVDFNEKFRQLEENNRRVLEQMEFELSHKNQECLEYCNEIKRLNQVVSDLNNEVGSNKNHDEKITELNIEIDRLKTKNDELNSSFQVDREQMKKIQDETVFKYTTQLNQLNSKLEESVQYYESVIRSQNEEFKKNLLDEEQQQTRTSKELERLREHLIEMSDSYNKEAILAEEREKQLRLALTNAQQMIQQQGSTIESSRF